MSIPPLSYSIYPDDTIVNLEKIEILQKNASTSKKDPPGQETTDTMSLIWLMLSEEEPPSPLIFIGRFYINHFRTNPVPFFGRTSWPHISFTMRNQTRTQKSSKAWGPCWNRHPAPSSCPHRAWGLPRCYVKMLSIRVRVGTYLIAP